MKISVCMAVYNGARFLNEQMDSIISQLPEESELIIVNDKSTDNSLDLINLYSDERIKLISNDINLGHVKSFEKALEESIGDVVFLVDQDDVWVENRANLMIKILAERDELLLTGNSSFIDEDGRKVNFFADGVREADSKRHWSNISSLMLGKSTYFGCAMLFRRELLDVVLPFPEGIEAHDQWLAICSNLMNRNAHANETVLHRRIHNSNVSYRKRNLFKKLKSRLIQVYMIAVGLKRIYKKENINV